MDQATSVDPPTLRQRLDRAKAKLQPAFGGVDVELARELVEIAEAALSSHHLAPGFVCDDCGQRRALGPAGKAELEYLELFGREPDETDARVCDDCYRKIRPEINADLAAGRRR
jgi:hypothetical protein